jgi:hypothetical protein
MMTQEEYMDVIALHRQGSTRKQIAEALERHPATIAKWIENGGTPARREFTEERIVDERWQRRIGQLLSGTPICSPPRSTGSSLRKASPGPIRPWRATCARFAGRGAPLPALSRQLTRTVTGHIRMTRRLPSDSLQ